MKGKILILLTLLLFGALPVEAQTSVFTYQGKLIENGNPANANYDFEFKLYDALSGTLLGTRTRLNVAVTNGGFTVTLDFPTTLFDGSDRDLEIGVRTAGSPGGYQALSPRQALTSAPYAFRSLTATTAINATTATNATQLGGVAASQYVVTTDPRMTDARPPTAGSASYIQNSASQQATSNFNISGNGTADGTLSGSIVNAATQYNLNGARILSNAGSFNMFVGESAGNANTTGQQNSFYGYQAGTTNSSGSGNSFFGYNAGRNSNGSGSFNSFFGSSAGDSNTAGGSNAFFGADAGFSNITGNNNSFFGALAGNNNTSGGGNSFFGERAGSSNIIGSGNSFFGTEAGRNNKANSNSFFGSFAGVNNTNGLNNAFFGRDAGTTNTTGSNNTLIGALADVGANNLTYATAIGADAVASLSNSIYLGRASGADAVRIPGATIIDGSLVVHTLGSAGSATLCLNAADRLAPCSSSRRYKANIVPFRSGLELINKLRPVSFTWKDSGRLDLGLVAEEVATIEPLLTTTNASGEVEGVKYDRIAVILLNAVKEQQAQIEVQQKQLRAREQQTMLQQQQLQQQQQELAVLKQWYCRTHPKTAICQTVKATKR